MDLGLKGKLAIITGGLLLSGLCILPSLSCGSAWLVGSRHMKEKKHTRTR